MDSQELRAIATLDNSINGMQFQPEDTGWHTTERVNTYIIECLDRYWASEPIDTDLWEEFRADFEGWTKKLFALAHKSVRGRLKETLRDQGVYVALAGQNDKSLFEVLNEKEPAEWPQEQLERQIKRHGFKSWLNPNYRQRIEAMNAPAESAILTSATPAPVPRGETQSATMPTPLQGQLPPLSQQPVSPALLEEAHYFPPGAQFSAKPFQRQLRIPQSPPQRYTSGYLKQGFGQRPSPRLPLKALTDLAKLYALDPTQRFSGDKYDVFDTKLGIFEENAWKAGITQHFEEAFSSMLTGDALEFYRDYLARQNVSFEQMLERVRAYFHSPE